MDTAGLAEAAPPAELEEGEIEGSEHGEAVLEPALGGVNQHWGREEAGSWPPGMQHTCQKRTHSRVGSSLITCSSTEDAGKACGSGLDADGEDRILAPDASGRWAGAGGGGGGRTALPPPQSRGPLTDR